MTLGSTSFEDLRTVNGQLYDTFQQACQALGMLEDDTEWQAALADAATMQTGSQLRSLFAIILLHCQPTSPGELWTQFRVQICDDLRRRIQRENAAPPQVNVEDPSPEHVWDFGLYLLDVILNANKTSLAQIPGMPTFALQWVNQLANRYIREQRSYDPDEQQARAREAVGLMNAEQRTAYTAIVDSVMNTQGKLFFLTGPGGTGKTFVYGAVANSIRGGDRIVLCVASSGIAALLLEGGTTAHSCFNIPLDIQEGRTCSISKTHAKAELIRQASAIIWDEAPMQHRYCMEAVDATCRDIRESEEPFGGLTVVFGGDFRQILPVIPKGSRQEIIAASLSRSTLWQRIQILPLTQNMRLDRNAEEAVFATWLLRIGEGQEQEGMEGMVTLPAASKVIGGIIDLIKISYPNLERIRQPPDWFAKRSILSTRNHDVDDINLRVLNMFPGLERVMLSADKVVEDEHDVALTGGDRQLIYTPEFLQSVSIPGFPLAKLRLKVGVPVMVLRNLDPSNGICNGTRLLLTQIRPRILEGIIMGGKFNGKRVYIPRITFISNKDDLPFILSRRQFPVRLAFSMTINKSQGQSLWFVGLDLRTPVFSHGQLYVALSRSTSVARLKILFPPDSEDTKTTNVVWPEALINN
jgi:PIF1-like helicase